MKTMIIDTSTSFLYVSFVDNNKEFFQKILKTPNNHSENLLNAIREGLSTHHLEVKDFTKIIIGIGPGSYTGLRVSTIIAKMFAWTSNIPLYTISSLDVIASGYYSTDGEYAVTSIAKKDYLYTRIVKIENGKYSLIADDRFVLAEQFNQEIASSKYHIIDENCFKFSASTIVELAKNEITDVKALVPNYLRKANT
ncbi:MAG: tRNA (adenosine(37)-N6)-threonylcarbamoyltransferase complex dimerization subunit type 1 TsaB [Bacilli bacterium]|jgi:tRNA threonylcarbamoyladenosine biosynthesis protein TsaB|nr:tRNA (adenosine(37)-N6)-threonylcarbamoyltransferase complex dimerization subunit type 1 TsaB [Bacilli bacterium]MDD3348146.1 tRNA (adenosine(37)-N6)-threonylcarbamoyltransferase complex dimerization subunit type 1 TsaB [Bacilli bacterium]MDD4056059.1 tRNA (adenosine(37)-N6)-threonylcarbamoyltransferase complex dimerization subunit type 1 TsaB [Bacilli bacterium]MDY0208596.1 tRNA (adenosine(37)-N6)-threonylcarbamoyltransferase complex dimerization subunit type 1 TsaB [Bacilli bacterium]